MYACTYVCTYACLYDVGMCVCTYVHCTCMHTYKYICAYKIFAGIGGHCLTTFQSAALSSMFDVGAMIGK